MLIYFINYKKLYIMIVWKYYIQNGTFPLCGKRAIMAKDTIEKVFNLLLLSKINITFDELTLKFSHVQLNLVRQID